MNTEQHFPSMYREKKNWNVWKQQELLKERSETRMAGGLAKHMGLAVRLAMDSLKRRGIDMRGRS